MISIKELNMPSLEERNKRLFEYFPSEQMSGYNRILFSDSFSSFHTIFFERNTSSSGDVKYRPFVNDLKENLANWEYYIFPLQYAFEMSDMSSTIKSYAQYRLLSREEQLKSEIFYFNEQYHNLLKGELNTGSDDFEDVFADDVKTIHKKITEIISKIKSFKIDENYYNFILKWNSLINKYELERTYWLEIEPFLNQLPQLSLQAVPDNLVFHEDVVVEPEEPELPEEPEQPEEPNIPADKEDDFKEYNYSRLTIIPSKITEVVKDFVIATGERRGNVIEYLFLKAENYIRSRVNVEKIPRELYISLVDLSVFYYRRLGSEGVSNIRTGSGGFTISYESDEKIPHMVEVSISNYIKKLIEEGQIEDESENIIKFFN